MKTRDISNLRFLLKDEKQFRDIIINDTLVKLEELLFDRISNDKIKYFRVVNKSRLWKGKIHILYYYLPEMWHSVEVYFSRLKRNGYIKVCSFRRFEKNCFLNGKEFKVRYIVGVNELIDILEELVSKNSILDLFKGMEWKELVKSEN